MKSSRQLERWLAREVHGREIPFKPPGKARRGPARDEDFRKWIRSHPCVCCGCAWSVECAHVGTDGGMSMKASDYLAIPLCTNCHTMRPARTTASADVRSSGIPAWIAERWRSGCTRCGGRRHKTVVYDYLK